MAVLASPTLTELLEEIRGYLGQPDANNSQWTDRGLTRFINKAIRRYFKEVIQHSEGQFTEETDLDITSGSRTISLPSDFFEVVRLYKKIGDSYIPLEYDNAFNLAYTTQGSGTANSYTPSYKLRGNNLVLNNTPQFSETAGLRLEYISLPDTIINGGDSMTSDVAPVFRDLIIMYSVYQAQLAVSLRGNALDTVSVSKSDLSDLYATFRDVIYSRSHAPDFVKPFNYSYGDTN